jgi:hypothetical protein
MGCEWHLDGTWEIQPMVYMRFSGIHHPGELHESIQAITAITTIYIYPSIFHILEKQER